MGSAPYTQILYSVEDQIATVTMNRPEKLNAFTNEMAHEIIDAVDRIDADDDVRAAVFTGAGRAFCAGADLANDGEILDFGPDAVFDMATYADMGGVVSLRLRDCTKPLIAAINGPAVGIGSTMTLPMDVRLASDTARIGFVFTRRGVVPEACSSWFLPRIVGISQAAEWVYSGRVFDAAEALRGGLVRTVYPVDELLAQAYACARSMIEHTSAVSVALSRKMLWRMLTDAATPEDAHELDSRGIFYLGRSADAHEGITAFLQKRPAQFPMRVSTDMPEFFHDWPV